MKINLIFIVLMYSKILQQHDNWYTIIPSTISQQVIYSNVEKTIYDCDSLLLNYDKENNLSLNYYRN